MSNFREHKKWLLKRVQGGEELKMPQWGTRAGDSLSCFKKFNREENELVEEERSFSQCGVPAVHGYSAGDSVETLQLPRNEVEAQVLQGF